MLAYATEIVPRAYEFRGVQTAVQAVRSDVAQIWKSGLIFGGSFRHLQSCDRIRVIMERDVLGEKVMGLSALLLMFPDSHIASIPALELDEDLLSSSLIFLSSWKE